MAKYEYRVATHPIANAHENILDPLNAAGADGWQAIDILWLNSNFVVVTMMRQVEEKKDGADGPNAIPVPAERRPVG